MKKSIAFLGALLFGSVTFAQVSKNDATNKTSSRKVSTDDVKNLPPNDENAESGEIKGRVNHKDSGLGVSPSRIKGSNPTIKGEKSSDYPIKMDGARSTANDSTSQGNKSSDYHIKMSPSKTEKTSNSTFLKVSPSKD